MNLALGITFSLILILAAAVFWLVIQNRRLSDENANYRRSIDRMIKESEETSKPKKVKR